MSDRGTIHIGVVYPSSGDDSSVRALGEVPELFYHESNKVQNLVALPERIDGVKLVAGMMLVGTGDYFAENGSQVMPEGLQIYETPTKPSIGGQ